MASWGAKRQLIYISISLLILIVLVGIPIYYKYLNIAPTCSDGRQNQGEKGIDCGGPCAKLCSDESKDPLTVFERISQVAPGMYSVLAMVENNNQGVYAGDAQYVFKTYDKDNVLLDERFGNTFIPPSKQFPILEHSVFTGERTPAKTSFSFLYPINWQRGDVKEPSLEVLNIVSTSTDTLPQITAQLQNNEVYAVKNIQAIVIIYGEDNNVIGISQTIVDSLDPKSKTSITFTWNGPFSGKVSKIDIIPRATPREFAK